MVRDFPTGKFNLAHMIGWRLLYTSPQKIIQKASKVNIEICVMRKLESGRFK